MRHVALFLASIALASLGFYVVAVNAKQLTTGIELFGGGAVVLSLLLAFPTDTVAAFAAVMNAVKAWRSPSA
jgi:hypothetical protein